MTLKPFILAATAAILASCSGTSVAVIPKLNPVDIYLNLETRGFTVTKDLQPGHLTWTCTQSWPSVEFRADVSGPAADQVSLVRASVTADGVNKTALAGQEYLAMVASIPYADAQPQAARDWVIAHYNEDGSTTSIGGATFTLHGTTDAYRMLTIAPGQ